eukprot:COSAG01_NODE_1013_length_12138_cov_7.073926_7_plen_67_part_00
MAEIPLRFCAFDLRLQACVRITTRSWQQAAEAAAAAAASGSALGQARARWLRLATAMTTGLTSRID